MTRVYLFPDGGHLGLCRCLFTSGAALKSRTGPMTYLLSIRTCSGKLALVLAVKQLITEHEKKHFHLIPTDPPEFRITSFFQLFMEV